MGVMQRISEDIKNNNFKQAYLLCGSEDYLRNQYRNRLRDALLDGGDEMNLSFYEGKDTNVKAIIDLAETMPFLAERRVIVIENSGFFKNSSAEDLAEYLKEPAASTFFVFNESEVDKRNKLYKAVAKLGYVGEFNAQDEATLARWVAGMVKKEGMEIDNRALSLLLYKTGTDMENIYKELEKCICYCMKRGKITAEDVEEICTQRMENRIFDMINYAVTGRQKEALRLYYDLLSLKEPPMRILFLISKQFNQLLQTRTLRDRGADKKIIAESLGVPPFVAAKCMDQAARFKRSTLRQALDDCVQAEEDVKTGRLSDVMSVELILIKYSQAK